eukprot:g2877.t1
MEAAVSLRRHVADKEALGRERIDVALQQHASVLQEKVENKLRKSSRRWRQRARDAQQQAHKNFTEAAEKYSADDLAHSRVLHEAKVKERAAARDAAAATARLERLRLRTHATGRAQAPSPSTSTSPSALPTTDVSLASTMIQGSEGVFEHEHAREHERAVISRVLAAKRAAVDRHATAVQVAGNAAAARLQQAARDEAETRQRHRAAHPLVLQEHSTPAVPAAAQARDGAGAETRAAGLCAQRHFFREHGLVVLGIKQAWTLAGRRLERASRARRLGIAWRRLARVAGARGALETARAESAAVMEAAAVEAAASENRLRGAHAAAVRVATAAHQETKVKLAAAERSVRANELRAAVAERARDAATEARDELKQRHAAMLARTEDDHVQALAAAGAAARRTTDDAVRRAVAARELALQAEHDIALRAAEAAAQAAAADALTAAVDDAVKCERGMAEQAHAQMRVDLQAAREAQAAAEADANRCRLECERKADERAFELRARVEEHASHVRKALRRVVGAVLTRRRRWSLQNAMSTWRSRAAAFDAIDTAHSLAIEVEELSHAARQAHSRGIGAGKAERRELHAEVTRRRAAMHDMRQSHEESQAAWRAQLEEARAKAGVLERQCGRLQLEVQTHVADADTLRREYDAAVAAHTSAEQRANNAAEVLRSVLGAVSSQLENELSQLAVDALLQPALLPQPQHSVASVNNAAAAAPQPPLSPVTPVSSVAPSPARASLSPSYVAPPSPPLLRKPTAPLSRASPLVSVRDHSTLVAVTNSAYSVALRELQQAIDNARQRAATEAAEKSTIDLTQNAVVSLERKLEEREEELERLHEALARATATAAEAQAGAERARAEAQRSEVVAAEALQARANAEAQCNAERKAAEHGANAAKRDGAIAVELSLLEAAATTREAVAEAEDAAARRCAHAEAQRDEAEAKLVAAERHHDEELRELRRAKAEAMRKLEDGWREATAQSTRLRSELEALRAEMDRRTREADARAKSAQLGSESSVKRMQQARRRARLSEKRVEQLQSALQRRLDATSVAASVDASVVVGSGGDDGSDGAAAAAAAAATSMGQITVADSADLGMDADANANRNNSSRIFVAPNDHVIAPDETEDDTAVVAVSHRDSFSAFFFPPEEVSGSESSGAIRAHSQGKETCRAVTPRHFRFLLHLPQLIVCMLSCRWPNEDCLQDGMSDLM